MPTNVNFLAFNFRRLSLKQCKSLCVCVRVRARVCACVRAFVAVRVHMCVFVRACVFFQLVRRCVCYALCFEYCVRDRGVYVLFF